MSLGMIEKLGIASDKIPELLKLLTEQRVLAIFQAGALHTMTAGKNNSKSKTHYAIKIESLTREKTSTKLVGKGGKKVAFITNMQIFIDIYRVVVHQACLIWKLHCVAFCHLVVMALICSPSLSWTCQWTTTTLFHLLLCGFMEARA